MNNRRYALHYVSQGYHILPTHYNRDGNCSCGRGNCKSPFKHPCTRNGVLDATTDPEQIKKWWGKDNWNVAIRTGRESGVFIVDVDDEGDLAHIEELPKTLTAVTPRGCHFYFVWEEGITNRSKIWGLRIDVRGENGYCIMPPSPGYHWMAEQTIVTAPNWLVKGIRKG